jgi:hypothetical protein
MSENGQLPSSVRYPGIPNTSDGSGTVSWVETNITQGACAYPITSSTVMGSNYAEAVANGKTNLWGDRLIFMEPESEHSSASAAEGFAVAGGRVTNFTSGQGLILMKEVLYVISGKRLPIVFMLTDTQILDDRWLSLINDLLASGNIPVPALQSMVFGLLLRSAQFVKCASGRTLLPRLFAHSLAATEPRLGSCLELASWPRGNADLDAALFAQDGFVQPVGALPADRQFQIKSQGDALVQGGDGGGVETVVHIGIEHGRFPAPDELCLAYVDAVILGPGNDSHQGQP